MPPKSVENKRVLITGAASGIGRATAVTSARKGARLYLTDINEAPLAAVAAEIRAAGGGLARVQAAETPDPPAGAPPAAPEPPRARHDRQGLSHTRPPHLGHGAQTPPA